MKVVVTGADGLLGSNLVRQLLAAGHAVKAIVLPGLSTPTLAGLVLETVPGDLTDPRLELGPILDGADAIIHAAAITDLRARPELVFRVNLEATRRLLDAALDAGIKRFIFVGSGSSYRSGPLDAPGDETGPFPEVYRGVAYMESKKQAADLVLSYHRDRGLDALVVAPTFMIGPYDSRPSGGELIKQYLEKGLSFATPGGRDFAHAVKVAAAIVAALEKGRAGQTYILGGENLSYQDFFTRVAAITGAPAPKRVVPAALILAAGRAASAVERALGRRLLFNHDLARFSLVEAYYNSAKAEQELGLECAPIDMAIEDSIKSLVSYGHLHLPHAASFKGKAALITGASRGLGFALARALVLRGAKVAMTARGERRLLESAEKLRRLGAEVVAVAGDVGKTADANRMVKAAVDAFGRLDLVVNNAGVSMRGDFAELTPEVIERVSRTNWDGCVNISHPAMAELIKHRGSLVFISSVGGIFGLPGASIYCATKKALVGLAESLRIELAGRGVHVGVVYLGFTEHDPEKRILAADGQLVLPDRPAHHTQAEAAEIIIRMIARRRPTLAMTPAGKLGAIAYRLSPRLVERAIIAAGSLNIGMYKKFK